MEYIPEFPFPQIIGDQLLPAYKWNTQLLANIKALPGIRVLEKQFINSNVVNFRYGVQGLSLFHGVDVVVFPVEVLDDIGFSNLLLGEQQIRAGNRSQEKYYD